MEALSFIFQRLYISFASGSIINFYIIYTFFVLEKDKLLPKCLVTLKSIGFSPSVYIWIFIFSALLIGIFVEGFSHGGVQLYKENIDKFIKKKKEKNDKEENEFRNLNLKGKMVYLLFMKSTITETCIYYLKQQNKEEKDNIFKFLYDFNIDNPYYNRNEMFLGIQTIAFKVSNKLGNSDFYRFRDLSFMIQILRSSFILTSLFSFFITIYVVTINSIRNDWNNEEKSFLFFPICIIISVLLIIVTTIIAGNFSKRYLRELGSCYNALNFQKQS